MNEGKSNSNYAINPTPELDLRSNRAVLSARVIAALDLSGPLEARPRCRGGGHCGVSIVLTVTSGVSQRKSPQQAIAQAQNVRWQML